MTAREKKLLRSVVGTTLLVLAAMEAFAWFVPLREARALVAEVEKLDKDVDLYARRKEQLSELEDELIRGRDELAQYVQILPDASAATEAELLSLLTSFRDQASRGEFSGLGSLPALEIRSFKPDVAGKGGAKEAAKVDFTHHAYQANLVGSFFQFVKFLSLLETHKRFFQVNEFSVDSFNEGGGGGEEGVVAASPAVRRWQFILKFSTYTYNPGGRG